MTRSVLVLLVLFFAGPGDGDKKGRQGNALYESEKYQEAAAAYAEGLAAEAELPAQVRYGLHNNLGAALHQSGDYDAAQGAFDQALALATTDADYARASYNAGNNAVAREQLEDAVARYREALLADPTNEDAKFNYEFARRRLQQQQQQNGQNDQQDQQQNEQNQQQDQQGQDDQQQQQDQQNQQQQNDQQNQQQQDQQQQDQQQQDQQQQDQQQGDDEQQQQQQPDPTKMSQEQAERILQALQNEEQQLLRQVQQPKTQPRRVEKDW